MDIQKLSKYVNAHKHFRVPDDFVLDTAMIDGSGETIELTFGDLKELFDIAYDKELSELKNNRMAQAACAVLGGIMVTELELGPQYQKEASDLWMEMIHRLAFFGILVREYDKRRPEYLLFKTTATFREMAIKFNMTLTPEAQTEAMNAFQAVTGS